MGSELVWPVYLGVISLTVALLSVGVMWVRGVHLVWSSIGLAASGLGAWAAFVMLWRVPKSVGQSGSACLGRGCPARSTVLGGHC